MTDQPTLTVAQNMTEDAVVFECAHGTIEGAGPSTTAIESATLVQIVMGRRECACWPTLVLYLFPDATTAIDLMVNDGTGDGASLDTAHATVREGLLSAIRRRDCACGPQIEIEMHAGVVRVKAYHGEGCAAPQRSRELRSIDLTAARA